jgi:hypothetical protein
MKWFSSGLKSQTMPTGTSRNVMPPSEALNRTRAIVQQLRGLQGVQANKVSAQQNSGQPVRWTR